MINRVTLQRCANLFYSWFTIDYKGLDELTFYPNYLSGKFLHGKVGKSKVTVPIFRRFCALNSLADAKAYKEALVLDNINANLSINEAISAWSSAPNGTISKIKHRGVTWYAGGGILLDSEGKVLLLVTVDVHNKKQRVPYISSDVLKYDNPVIRLSPELLTEPKYKVWRNILVDGIMPHFHTINIRTVASNGKWLSHNHDVHFSFEDLSSFVSIVPSPKGKVIEDTLTPGFMLEHLSEINNIAL